MYREKYRPEVCGKIHLYTKSRRSQRSRAWGWNNANAAATQIVTALWCFWWWPKRNVPYPGIVRTAICFSFYTLSFDLNLIHIVNKFCNWFFTQFLICLKSINILEKKNWNFLDANLQIYICLLNFFLCTLHIIKM